VIAAGILVFCASACDAHHNNTTAQTVEPRPSRPVTALPLKVFPARTPRFRVPRYDTRGTYPQVRGKNLDLARVNAALRRAIIADQMRYAPFARDAVRIKNDYRGLYETSVERSLLSASSVVVSALMPATELYPGGSLGKGWLATTVLVPSGRRIHINDLFVNPARALPVLANAWKEQLRRTNADSWECVAQHASDYAPVASNYQYFALTERGLAVGFWQEPACNRLYAIVRYPTLRPYLSALGSKVVAGVRPPA
jgi:hypothetical protein